MGAKTTWAVVISAVITGAFANLDRVTDLVSAYGLGVAPRRVAQAEEQIKLWQSHVGKKPVDIITVELPKGRVVQCQPYPDGDTLVVSQTADGESKSVWVPLEAFNGVSMVPTAYAASRRPYIVRVCAITQVFHKGIGRNVIMQSVLLSNGRCYARLVDPARKGKVLSQVRLKACPRECR